MILVWYEAPLYHLGLHKVVSIVQLITGSSSIQSVFMVCCVRKSRSILKKACQPGHFFFPLLFSGIKSRSLKDRTSKMKNSFFPTINRLLSKSLFHTLLPGGAATYIFLLITFFQLRIALQSCTFLLFCIGNCIQCCIYHHCIYTVYYVSFI